MDQHAAVLQGIHAASEVFGELKLDTVVLGGTNDDELIPLIEFGRRVNGEVRFIEYMDVGGATHWSPDAVVTRREILRPPRTALRPDRALRRNHVGARRSLSAAGRHDLRDHRVDDRAVLRALRPQPPDRRRPVLSVPVRDARDRHPPAAARGSVRRRTARVDPRDLGRAHRPRRRTARRRCPTAAPSSASPRSSATRTSKCTPRAARRAAVHATLLSSFSRTAAMTRRAVSISLIRSPSERRVDPRGLQADGRVVRVGVPCR